MFFDQAEYDIRFEWGERGVLALAQLSDVVVIVDVLSFSTSVAIATSRGAVVYPSHGSEESAAQFAGRKGAILAGRHRSGAGYTLSPSSLAAIPAGTRLVLPSPNGAALTAMASEANPLCRVLAGCLRNAGAVAEIAAGMGRRIAVIAAGERWPDGSLRPAIEDLKGAGAIIARLPGTCSPEAEMAMAVFAYARPHLTDLMRRCSSGRELIERGFVADVELAADLDACDCAPRLKNGEFYTSEMS